MENFVDEIINKGTQVITFEDRIKYKGLRPTPNVSIVSIDKKTKRHFQKKWYCEFPWLSGSSKKNRLYCYYCLLFGKGESTWNSTGIDSIKNFVQKAYVHSRSRQHLLYGESFRMLGKNRIDYQLNSVARQNAMQHNEIVKRNRRVIARMFHCVLYLARHEIAYRAHDESELSSNRGNYIGLLEMLALEEPFLEQFMKTSTVFKGTSGEIQNELINLLSIHIDEKIRREVELAQFVSIQADETNDISNMAQLSIIIRYVIKHEVYERFVGFFDISADKSAQAIANVILKVIKDYSISKKLISQTYDGAAAMSGNTSGVQTIVRETHKKAVFVHCFAHQLNLVLLHGCKSITEVRHFIAQLSDFHSFFHRSSTRSSLLKKEGFSMPSGSDTRWNYKSRAVRTIKNNYQQLIEIMSYIALSDKFCATSTSLALSLRGTLKNDLFIFLLCLFSKIFIKIDHVFDILQKKASSNVLLCLNEINHTERLLESMENNSELIEDLKKEAMKMKRSFALNFEAMKRLVNNITENLLQHMRSRFSEIEKLDFFSLLSVENFSNYKRNFPSLKMSALKEVYPNVCELEKLKNELEIIYSDENKQLTPPELLKYFVNNDLDDIYSETTKLAKICLTLPMSSASSERSMSTLKRIKTYLRNAMSETRLSDLAKISIEANMASDIIMTPSQMESLIDSFAQKKNRRIELVYKTL